MRHQFPQSPILLPIPPSNFVISALFHNSSATLSLTPVDFCLCCCFFSVFLSVQFPTRLLNSKLVALNVSISALNVSISPLVELPSLSLSRLFIPLSPLSLSLHIIRSFFLLIFLLVSLLSSGTL